MHALSRNSRILVMFAIVAVLLAVVVIALALGIGPG
jgi:hypothetical protein